ncbi:MAG: hypothetical protein HPY53_10275 [Brevinematales bacterium]|nr:hypothetical protein [Brevinematales bacterium]
MDYDKFYENEKKTIDAINSLSVGFPYASTMLIYLLIERLLKVYIIQNRRDKSKFNLGTYCEKCEIFCIENDEEFFNRFKMDKKCLGEIEKFLPKECKKYDTDRISKKRNSILHSNFYLKNDFNQSDEKRKEINRENFIVALDDLKYILENYSPLKIKLEETRIILIV